MDLCFDSSSFAHHALSPAWGHLHCYLSLGPSPFLSPALPASSHLYIVMPSATCTSLEGRKKTQHELMLLLDAVWVGWSCYPPGALPRLMPARQAQAAASPVVARGDAAGPDGLLPLSCDFMRGHGCHGLCLQPENSNSFHLSACSPGRAEASGEVQGGDSRAAHHFCSSWSPASCLCHWKNQHSCIFLQVFQQIPLPWLGTACCCR